MSGEALDFFGKVAVVTGASSGIGAQVALGLSKCGARVALVSNEEELLKEVAAKCSNDTIVVVADLTKDEAFPRIIADTIAAFGKIDILVNNAGLFLPYAFEGSDAIECYEMSLNINLHAIVKLTHATLPYLAETKGNIVNVSSISSSMPWKYGWAYCMSKAGVDMFTKSMADELAVKGIRVNAINPGPTDTSIVKNMGMNPSSMERFKNRMSNQTALKRLSEPEEQAEVILFLASDKARGVTGSCWVSDNGYLIHSKE